MMKFTSLLFILFPFLLSAQISIYSIQYTTNAGDGTYPSPHNGDLVTTGGIVTVANYNGGQYFIESSKGGAWNGIFIYDNSYSPSVGDSIIIKGTVCEYKGLTEIKNLESFTVVSSSNALPPVAQINSSQVTSEAFESVLVQVSNCAVTQAFDDYGNWRVDDGSGACDIRPGIYDLQDANFPIDIGYQLSFVKGIITDYYGKCILPRNFDDIQSKDDAFVMYSPQMLISDSLLFKLPVSIGLLNQSGNITSCGLHMTYDSTVIEYEGYEVINTLSENCTIIDSSTNGNINIVFNLDTVCNGIKNIVKLKFNPIKEGYGELLFNSPTINGNEVIFVNSGELLLGSNDCNIPQADTLTVVQRPIMNIPSILVPGDTLPIVCFATDTTTNWHAKLLFKDKTVDLDVTQSCYDPVLEKWTLKAIVPSVDIYELYDLNVTASGGISDTVPNCVKLIDYFRSNYYFVQITDTHLPGHTFYGQTGYKTDTSEMQDLREVIKDINLINPEFVIFTGDLVNEGELEDFECLRNHTKAFNLLKELEVPVYMVPGNHDLGGWDATPPPQGTARREWWRFFGWRQRTIPPVQPAYFYNDYSFNYGNVHFIGMEASVNYDNYLSDIYANQGFTSSQIDWLKNNLAEAGDKTKVLFYHYDFNNDIDLSALGADMALWGHIHKDADDYTYPYNIGTDGVVDGARSYRVIMVNNGELTPKNTLHTDSFSQNLDVVYSNDNNGSVDSLVATITNKQNVTFANALVKFTMPNSSNGYTVTNGVLSQVVNIGSKSVCYVNVNLEANSIKNVTVKLKDGISSIVSLDSDGNFIKFYPNPFNSKTKIEFKLKHESMVKLMVYNSLGQMVKVIVDSRLSSGQHFYMWNAIGANGEKFSSGVYFCRLVVNEKLVTTKQVVFSK